jgi:hypothetical protein
VNTNKASGNDDDDDVVAIKGIERVSDGNDVIIHPLINDDHHPHNKATRPEAPPSVDDAVADMNMKRTRHNSCETLNLKHTWKNKQGGSAFFFFIFKYLKEKSLIYF